MRAACCLSSSVDCLVEADVTTVEEWSSVCVSAGAKRGEDATLGTAASAEGVDCRTTGEAAGAKGAGALGTSGVKLTGADVAGMTDLTAIEGGAAGLAATGGGTGVTLGGAGADGDAAERVAACGRTVAAGKRMPQNPGSGSVNSNSSYPTAFPS